MRTWLGLVGGLLVSLAACSNREPPAPRSPGPTAAEPPPATEPTVATDGHQAVTPPGPATVARSLFTDRQALAVLAATGADLSALLTEADRAVIAGALREDVAATGKGDAVAGVGIRGNAHRLFDVSWLPRAEFELIGVVARPDRTPLTPTACGDVRLIYRLAYRAQQQGTTVASRLPMTLAVVLRGDARQPAGPADPTGCANAARAWQFAPDLTGDALATALRDGPLAGRLTRDRIVQVLTNAQVVRWPSAVRPDLGGHAEYILRQFIVDAGGTLIRDRVDGTPDTARLKRDPKASAALRAHVLSAEGLQAAAAGFLTLPRELRADASRVSTPRGLARLGNRPFRQLWQPADLAPALASLAPQALPHLGSPTAALRRLDEHTCAGCHATGAIAGFHLLGDEAADEPAGNAMWVTASPALVAEAARRDRLLTDLAAGRDVGFTRPVLERAANVGGRYARCGLGDPGFAAWTCEAPFTCQATDAPGQDGVGECLPPEPRGVGDPCEVTTLSPNADPRRDRMPRTAQVACDGNMVCNQNRYGFPGGMCTAGCDDLPDGGACGVIASLVPFNDCLARGAPFPQCFAHVGPAGLRACDATTPCRDDYVCAKAPSGGGVCMPPYFLFQLRVDGHPPGKALL